MSRATRSKHYIGQLELPFEEKRMKDGEIPEGMDINTNPLVDEVKSTTLKKGTNKKPKSKIEEKFEAQKKCLQRMVTATIARGVTQGLTGEEVAALKESLIILGWLPEDLRL